jgi:hypothetical protein
MNANSSAETAAPDTAVSIIGDFIRKPVRRSVGVSCMARPFDAIGLIDDLK